MARKKACANKKVVDRAARELRAVEREEKKLERLYKSIETKRKKAEARRKKAEAAANREADRLIAEADKIVRKIGGKKKSKKRTRSKSLAISEHELDRGRLKKGGVVHWMRGKGGKGKTVHGTGTGKYIPAGSSPITCSVCKKV